MWDIDVRAIKKEVTADIHKVMNTIDQTLKSYICSIFFRIFVLNSASFAGIQIDRNSDHWHVSSALKDVQSELGLRLSYVTVLQKQLYF